MGATIHEEAEALRWDEAFDFAADEYRALAQCLRAANGDDTAPRDGPEDGSIISYYENAYDTLAWDNDIPDGEWPDFVIRARREFFR